MHRALMILALAFVAPRAWAGLTWEATVLELQADPMQEQIEAVFRFTNDGAATVSIADVRPSCGCTTPELERRDYAPGESGEIRVVYKYGEATGPQEKTLTLTTAEPDAQTYLLTLRVTIPALFEIQPRFVKWDHGEAPAAKTIRIAARFPQIATPVSVESRDPRFSTELKASEDEPGVYVLTVKPESTDAPMFTSLAVTTSAATEKKRVLQLYATVR